MLDAEAILADEVCRSSADWLAAEMRVPFANRDRQLALHLRRLATLLTQQEQTHVYTNYGDGGKRQLARERQIRREFLEPALDQLRAAGDPNYATTVAQEMAQADPFKRQFPDP
jgi:hypothetical protein